MAGYNNTPGNRQQNIMNVSGMIHLQGVIPANLALAVPPDYDSGQYGRDGGYDNWAPQQQQQQQQIGYSPQNDVGYPPSGYSEGGGYAQPGGYSQQQQQQQQIGYPQNVGYQAVAPSIAPSSQRLPPPDITGPPEIVGGQLWQRLATIPEPTVCSGMGQPGMMGTPNAPMPAQPQQPRPRPIGTLAERLAAIPEPRACHFGGFREQVVEKTSPPPPQPSCGSPRSVRSHMLGAGGGGEEGRGEQEKFYSPVASSWSDGIGGHKIKSFPAASTGTSSSSKKKSSCLDMDGYGGRKPKGSEDD